MIATIVSGGLKAAVWSLAFVGIAVLLLGGLVAWPVRQPPELTSISAARKSVDFSALPAIERFQARGISPPVNVKLIDGVNHMGIVSNPAAISVIADDVATAGLSS
jgi:hypothetical protein